MPPSARQSKGGPFSAEEWPPLYPPRPQGLRP
nr:MAG TPA: hypothetical protein [Caudoviricetes sp.]